jgi:putative DNA primase/helicase
MDANLGLLTGAASGIVVLDVDPRHGGDDALRSLTGKHGDLPETWRFLTGGAGEHIVFSAPAGVAVPNSAGLLGEGLDVRGERGLIVGPGSVHASGRRYEISVDHHPADVDLAAVPAWLLERMTAAPATAGRAKSSETVPAGVVPEGKRNQRLAQLIGRLLARGVDPIEAAQLVIGFNFRWCAPPLAEAEVLRVIDSIAGRQLRKLEA